MVVAEFDTDNGKRAAGELAELGGEGWFVHTDIMQLDTVVAAVEKTVEHWGTIDIVVNNAYPTMVYGPAKIEAIDQQRLRDSMTAGFLRLAPRCALLIR